MRGFIWGWVHIIYIYIGVWVMDLFGFWIFGVDFGWILWDEGDKKVGFAEKKLRLWVLAWAAAWEGALRGGRKILRPYI